jgi:hypothetical protein
VRLDCIWPLINVAEWAFAYMVNLFQDLTEESGKLAWYGKSYTSTSTSSQLSRRTLLTYIDSNLLLITQPILLDILHTILSQLSAFVKFVPNIEKAILVPTSGTLNLVAAGMARDRVAGMNETLNLEIWIQSLGNLRTGMSLPPPLILVYSN